MADQDGLLAMIRRFESTGEFTEHALLLEAARMVGAGTLITGRFTHSADMVHIDAEMVHGPTGGRAAKVHVAGRLEDMSSLERGLFEHIADALGLGSKAGRRPPAVPLAAREKLVLAKQAYLRGDYENAISLSESALGAAPGSGA